MTWGFEIGRTYNRRSDIHDRFGGQQQGGIITPKAFNLVMVVTGEEGGQHGYADTLRPDGVFEYYGEGQKGDMQWVRGNLAIAEHAANGKDLLLFRKTKVGLRFEGQYVVEGVINRTAPDTTGAMRAAFVFELRPLDAIIEAVSEMPGQFREVELTKLREKALSAARQKPGATKSSVNTVYERSRAVRDYVLARAKGTCEHCGDPAPFTTASGTPYLEVHHIRRMSDGGPDDFHFMIGICPNCHRRAHHGGDAKVQNQEMLDAVKQLEQV